MPADFARACRDGREKTAEEAGAGREEALRRRACVEQPPVAPATIPAPSPNTRVGRQRGGACGLPTVLPGHRRSELDMARSPSFRTRAAPDLGRPPCRLEPTGPRARVGTHAVQIGRRVH